MRKGLPFVIKGLSVLLVAGVMYSIHLQMLTSHVTKEQRKIVETKRNNKLPQPPPMERLSLNSSLQKDSFEERDMLDEHGNPFTIILWISHRGTPGYLANPEECLGNIKCQIVYPGVIKSESAHAIVFKADHISSNPFPEVR